jgi:peroxiredoxin
MAATPSTMMPLGTQAPAFELPDTLSGRMLSLNDLRSEKATLVMFICNHCPYVKHIMPVFVRMAGEYQKKGISFIAISSNDALRYPDDAPDKMKRAAREWGFTFPYLYDERQQVARDYNAACTPDFFLFDGAMKCVYRGQFDDARPKNEVPVSGRDLRKALDAVLSGMPVDPDQKPSIGCNIKWKEA